MCITTFILDDAILPTDVPAATNATTESACAVGIKEEEVEGCVEGIEKLIQDLSSSDDTRVNTSLLALYLDLDKDEEKSDTVTVWGGCAALIHLFKDRLKK